MFKAGDNMFSTKVLYIGSLEGDQDTQEEVPIISRQSIKRAELGTEHGER
jgi:hypothetical protein